MVSNNLNNKIKIYQKNKKSKLFFSSSSQVALNFIQSPLIIRALRPKPKRQNPSRRFFAAAVPRSSALLLLPLSPVRNPGISARRPHPRWLLCPWLGAARRRVTACRRLCSHRRFAGCRRVSVEG
ncbi:hypothetical protein AHAS_Ahas19G0133800 [Arachis hypogaea]